MLAFLILAIIELHKILREKGPVPSLGLLIVSSALIYLSAFSVVISFMPVQFLGVALFVLFLALMVQFLLNSGHVVEKTGKLLLVTVYLNIPLILLNLLYYRDFSFDGHAIHLLLGLFIITWFNDTFAYIIGSSFGRHKLAERISPNKTWEGGIGGLVFSLIAAWLLSMAFKQFDLMQWLVLSIIIVIFGTMGDLIESVLKRNAGVKESGTLIPGHGGILDRIDSILIATPFVFIYLYFFLN
jgi:phosphatidate cytidylyltransferase